MRGRVRLGRAGRALPGAILFLLLASGTVRSADTPTPGPAAEGPRQPIFFSHRIHAGDFKIDCQYCHADARRSAYAGVPSVRRCMGCHQIVASKDAELQKEVEKLRAYWKEGRPVPWTRIHKVPGFVQFPHKRHVQVELACQTSHGPVETMAVVAQVAPLTMGWCISCHAERQGPLDCVTCHH